MSWLVRLDLPAEAAQRAGLLDTYDWHQRLWECFPDAPAHERDFLTRIDFLEGAVRAWMLAEREPACPAWCPPDDFQARKVASSFLSHSRYAFDLHVNPTKSLVQHEADGSPKRKANGKRASGKRVPLVAQEELRAWIDRKASESGFRVSEVKPLEIGPAIDFRFRKKGMFGVHGGVKFRGILEVTDPVRFASAWKSGIGSAKAFGFGLLLLHPVQL